MSNLYLMYAQCVLTYFAVTECDVRSRCWTPGLQVGQHYKGRPECTLSQLRTHPDLTLDLTERGGRIGRARVSRAGDLGFKPMVESNH